MTTDTLDVAKFDAMFAADDDPWRFRTRWYEARKRALTLAALPQARYARGFEPGCANGELAAALATRCDALLASDASEPAVALARRRLADQRHVRVARMRMPDHRPAHDGPFDLIVVSELGYYLTPEALRELAGRCRASLSPGGTLLACHWRAPIEGCALDGDGVHRLIGESLGWPVLATHREADFVLDVWSSDARSVARREGFA